MNTKTKEFLENVITAALAVATFACAVLIVGLTVKAWNLWAKGLI